MAVAAFVISLVALAWAAYLHVRSRASGRVAADDALARRVDELEERLAELEASRGVEALERAAARSS